MKTQKLPKGNKKKSKSWRNDCPEKELNRLAYNARREFNAIMGVVTY